MHPNSLSPSRDDCLCRHRRWTGERITHINGCAAPRDIGTDQEPFILRETPDLRREPSVIEKRPGWVARVLRQAFSTARGALNICNIRCRAIVSSRISAGSPVIVTMPTVVADRRTHRSTWSLSAEGSPNSDDASIAITPKPTRLTELMGRDISANRSDWNGCLTAWRN